MPVLPLAKQLRGELLVTAQSVCFGERDQMLVPVQFPRDFAIAHLHQSRGTLFGTTVFAERAFHEPDRECQSISDP